MTLFADGVQIGPTKGRRFNKVVRGSIAIMEFVPSILDRNGFCAAQQIGAAGNLTLNGALVVGGVGIADDAGVEMWGRCVGFYSSGNLSAITFTVYGYDTYGEPLVASRAGPNNSTVSTTKAFGRVARIAASAAVGTNVEVGTVDTFGLPLYLKSLAMVVRSGFDEVLAEDAATVVAGVTTTATASTGDVRGTFTPSAAADGSKRIACAFIPDLTSRQTKLGVKQYGAGLV